MIFHIPAGSVDIIAGDYVQVSPSVLDLSPDAVDLESIGYCHVVSVSGAKLTQVQIQYPDSQGNISVIWIDVFWFVNVLRPQSIT